MSEFKTSIYSNRENKLVITQEHIRTKLNQTVILNYSELIELGWTAPVIKEHPDFFNDGFDSKLMHEDLF